MMCVCAYICAGVQEEQRQDEQTGTPGACEVRG